MIIKLITHDVSEFEFKDFLQVYLNSLFVFECFVYLVERIRSTKKSLFVYNEDLPCKNLELICIKGAETNNIVDIGKLGGDVLSHVHD